MFTQEIATITNAAAKKEAVREILSESIANDTFTYTELLCADEPMRTMGLEILDGIIVESGRPMPGAAIEDWGGKRFRLVCVEENGTIKIPVLADVKIPGTHKTKREEVMKDFGNICDMTDAPPTERLARNVLYQRGWPIKQTKSRGNKTGDVVEWKWLEKEAALGQGAAPGVVELYERLLPRVIAFDEAQAKAAEAAAKAAAEKRKNKNAGPSAAPAGV